MKSARNILIQLLARQALGCRYFNE